MKSITLTVVIGPDGKVGFSGETNLHGISADALGDACGCLLCAAGAIVHQVSSSFHDLACAPEAAKFSDALRRSVAGRRDAGIDEGFLRLEIGGGQ